MSKARLDQTILGKLARKRKKPEKAIREQVSKFASRHGISSEAALAVLAARYGLGYQRLLRRLPAVVQSTVSELIRGARAQRLRREVEAVKEEPKRSADPLPAAISLLLTDRDLRRRCGDLLRRRGPLDRAVREAMTVLEDRLRKESGLGKQAEKSRSNLVGRAINPDPRRAIIVMSEDPGEQGGMFYFCKGLLEGFGNRVHHTLNEETQLSEALALCGAVNIVLELIRRQAKIYKDRVAK